MTTYWKAETYEHGDLAKIDFPERPTQREAIEDAANAISSCSDAELAYTEAGVEEWTEDEDGNLTNSGKWSRVNRNGEIVVEKD